MTEKSNENLIKDTTKKPEKESGAELEISPSPELKKLAESISTVQNVIDHNQPIELKQLQQIEEAMKKITVNIGGEEMTVEELEKIPDLKRNAKIWEKIKAGNFNIHSWLTYITPEVAEYLFRHKGNLELSGLTSLSDQAAKFFSGHEGNITLNGLSTISDKVAEYLSNNKGSLGLRGLTHLSDQAAEHLARLNGTLVTLNLTSLSDKAAEHFSRHQGNIFLSGLLTLSDIAAEHLARHKGRIFASQKILDQIAKFKK